MENIQNNIFSIWTAATLGIVVGSGLCVVNKLQRSQQSMTAQGKSNGCNGFPNTQTVENDSFYIKNSDKKCGEDSDKQLSALVERTLNAMSFKEVEIEKISKREKVFEFGLKYGYKIRILSSISNGKNKSKKNNIFFFI